MLLPWRARDGLLGAGSCGGATSGAPCSALVGAALGLLLASWIVPGLRRRWRPAGVRGRVPDLRDRRDPAPGAGHHRGAAGLGRRDPDRSVRPGAGHLAGALGTRPTTRPALWSSFLASWIVAAVSTLFVWVATAGTDDAVTASLLRGARRKRPPVLEDARHSGRRVRAGRRGALPGARVGRPRRHAAHAVPLDPKRFAPHGGVAAQAAGHHAGQPDGDPARDHRGHPRLPLGRPRRGTGLRRQQAGRRGRDRGDALERPRAARRRRRLGEQPVHRRRPDGVRDDERGPAHPGDAPGAGRPLPVPGPARRHGAEHVADVQRGRRANGSRRPARAGATYVPGCTAAGASRSSGPP